MEINKGQESYYPFEDSFRIFLFKKTERLSLALYLITSHLSNEESLRTNIRSLADRLIKDIIVFNGGYTDTNPTKKLKEDFLEVQTLLSISSSAKLISSSNIDLLIEEIARLNKDIENHKDILIGGVDIKKSFFVVDTKPKLPEPENTNKGHKGQENLPINAFPFSRYKESKDFDKRQTASISNNNRTEEIMKIIKDNEKVTIKDISLKIKDCSEKTIQRELLKMVSLNLIKKEGERRWSTYSVV